MRAFYARTLTYHSRIGFRTSSRQIQPRSDGRSPTEHYDRRTAAHAQVDAPRTDRVTILVGHQSGYLVHMREVVSDPRREEFR